MPTLDGDTDDDDEEEAINDVIPATDRLANCSLHDEMPEGSCSLIGDAKGEDDGEEEFEIVLAEGRGEEEGLNSMPESLGCSGFEAESVLNESDDVSLALSCCCCCCCCCSCNCCCC